MSASGQKPVALDILTGPGQAPGVACLGSPFVQVDVLALPRSRRRVAEGLLDAASAVVVVLLAAAAAPNPGPSCQRTPNVTMTWAGATTF